MNENKLFVDCEDFVSKIFSGSKISIRRDVVRFSSPGVLAVIWWAQSAPSGWNRVNRTPSTPRIPANDSSVYKTCPKTFLNCLVLNALSSKVKPLLKLK